MCTLLFNSGRMVCTGAKSEREARKAILTVVRKLKKGGINVAGKPEIKITNIVASGSLGASIDLEGLWVLAIRKGKNGFILNPTR
jgi:transcription initiation factor TFIID TATA-box-binding protein